MRTMELRPSPNWGPKLQHGCPGCNSSSQNVLRAVAVPVSEGDGGDIRHYLSRSPATEHGAASMGPILVRDQLDQQTTT